jgi:MFS family permease
LILSASDHRGWAAAWPGACATFVAVGIGRFSYTPLIPFLVSQGVLADTEAAYLGATNLLGYLVGACLAGFLGVRIGAARAIRMSFLAAALSLAACALPFGFWWLMPWRVLIGIASAVLMVLAPSVLLIRTTPAERGRAGGLIYTGVGFGTVLGGQLVAPLGAQGVAWAWGALALVAALVAAAAWRAWPREEIGSPRLPALRAGALRGGALRLDWRVLCLVLAFGMEGGGFVPHTIFWVDFIVRELGFGAAAGSLSWLVFGLGALTGPLVAGFIGDRIGLAVAVMLLFAVKALAVVMPVLSVATPALLVSSWLVGALSPGLTSILSARLSMLLAPAQQAPTWAIATLLFSLAQAGSAYGLAFMFTQTGSYRPLYAVGGGLEALGTLFAILSFAASRGHRARGAAAG